MLKRKADEEFKIIVLKQRIFSKIVRTLHSCNTTYNMSAKIRAMGNKGNNKITELRAILHGVRFSF
jgi:hypothetical protein